MNYLAEFFKISFIFPNQVTMFTMSKNKEEHINDCIQSLQGYFEKNDDNHNIFHDKNSNNFIEVIEYSKPYVFGIIGKSDNVKKGIMKRVKNKEGESLENTDLLLENYRYFALNTHNLYCSVIKNSAAPAFKLLFTNYITDILSEVLNRGFKITINNVYDNKIKTKVNKFTNLLELNLIFDNNSSLGSQLLSIDDLFKLSNSTLKKVNLSIDFKQQPLTDDFKKIITDDDLIKSNFKKFELVGDSSEASKETIELVEKLLTKNLKLDLKDNDLIGKESLDKIKKALQESLDQLDFSDNVTSL